MNAKLREVTRNDLTILHRWLNTDGALGEFDEASRPAMAQLEKKFESNGYKTTWIIESEGVPVGYANFALHPWDDWIACIGVIIAEQAARGKSIGTQAHILLASEIFSKYPDVFKLEAFTDVENLPERRALEKASFFLEGTQKRKNRLRGKFRDMHVFALLRPEEGA